MTGLLNNLRFMLAVLAALFLVTTGVCGYAAYWFLDAYAAQIEGDMEFTLEESF